MLVFKEGTTDVDGTDQAIIDSVKKHLQEKEGLIIRTTDQETRAKQKAIDDAFAARNNQFDETIKEATGVEKDDTEKTYDYLKRAMTKGLSEITELQDQIKVLKEKPGKNDSELVKDLKERLQTVQKAYEDDKKKFAEEIKKVSSSAFALKVDTMINGQVSKIKPLLKEMDEEVASAVIDNKIRKFKEEYTAVDIEGVIVFKDKAGQVLRKTENGDPKGVEDLISPMFETLIDKERKAAGTGSGNGNGGAGGGGAGGNEGKTDWSKEKLDNVKSKMQLTDWLKNEKKLDPDTKEHSEAFIEILKLKPDLPLRTPGA